MRENRKRYWLGYEIFSTKLMSMKQFQTILENEITEFANEHGCEINMNEIELTSEEKLLLKLMLPECICITPIGQENMSE